MTPTAALVLLALALAALAAYTIFAFHRVRQQLSAHTTAINETRVKVAKLERGDG